MTPKYFPELGPVSPLRIFCLAAVAFCLAFGSSCTAFAQAPYNDPETAEGWAWSQIKGGQVADFNKHCSTPQLDPTEKDERWNNPCRRLSHRFLESVLTDSPWRNAVTRAGVQLIGAQITGDVDLESSQLNTAIIISDSQIQGKINLERARADGLIRIEHTIVTGPLTAEFLHSDASLSLGRGSVFKRGATLSSARIQGEIDLTDAHLEDVLNLNGIEGIHLFMDSARIKAIDMRGGTIKGLASMIGIIVEGKLDADSIDVGGNLFMRSADQQRSSFQEVVLRNARIKGQVDMIGASFEGTLYADGIEVGGNLLMRSPDQQKTSFKEVVLSNARVKGQVEMIGASFEGKLYADGVEVGGNLLMRSVDQQRTSFKEVLLRGAQIKGYLDLAGSLCTGELDADSIQVGGSLFLDSDAQNEADFNRVILRAAQIKGQVSMTGANFKGALDAEAMEVGSTLLMYSDNNNQARFQNISLQHAKINGALPMRGAEVSGNFNGKFLQVGSYVGLSQASFKSPVDMKFSRVGSNLDVRGATFAELDLRGASLGADLQLADSEQKVSWQAADMKPGKLNLRNARVGNLMDARDAWPLPGNLFLHGFVFDRFGGVESDLMEMRKRPMKWWDEWVRRDSEYSPLAYTQLAAAFSNLGDRDAANDVRYFSHERAREEVCREWPQKRHMCVVQGALGLIAGYGIGTYSFRVVWWVIGFALAGALVLYYTVPAARAAHRGPFWCLGASLSQLIPVVQLNKEFADFFNDPKRRKLRGWQIAVFSALSGIGWILGGILVLAVSGLTQNP